MIYRGYLFEVYGFYGQTSVDKFSNLQCRMMSLLETAKGIVTITTLTLDTITCFIDDLRLPVHHLIPLCVDVSLQDLRHLRDGSIRRFLCYTIVAMSFIQLICGLR